MSAVASTNGGSTGITIQRVSGQVIPVSPGLHAIKQPAHFSPAIRAVASPILTSTERPAGVVFSPVLAPQTNCASSEVTHRSTGAGATTTVMRVRLSPGMSPAAAPTAVPGAVRVVASSTVPKAVSSSAHPTQVVQQNQRARQLIRVVNSAENEDTFVLPPAVDDDREQQNLDGAKQRYSSFDSEDGFELEYDERTAGGLAQDASLVRSPDGTHWVRSSRRFRLDSVYAIWYSTGSKKKRSGQQHFEEGLQRVGTVDSVQGFWRYWNAIDVRKVPDFSTLSVFKDPIKPMWEDLNNAGGGQWLLRCSDASESEEFLTKLVLALIGGYFECHEMIAGVVLNANPWSRSVGLWTTKAAQKASALVIELRELLGLENDESHTFEYRQHPAAKPEAGQPEAAKAEAAKPEAASKAKPGKAANATSVTAAPKASLTGSLTRVMAPQLRPGTSTAVAVTSMATKPEAGSALPVHGNCLQHVQMR